MLDIVLRRLDEPDEVREFSKGRFELHSGRATARCTSWAGDYARHEP